jgi:hypothetical protein
VSAITRPAPAERPAEVDEDITHLTCCSPDVALCGADVSDEPWVEGDTNDCSLCVLADESQAWCQDPGCPDRGAA